MKYHSVQHSPADTYNFTDTHNTYDLFEYFYCLNCKMFLHFDNENSHFEKNTDFFLKKSS